MVPANQHCGFSGFNGSYGGDFINSGGQRVLGYDYYCLESDLGHALMAEDESKTNNEPGSSSKDAHRDEEDDTWLQLSIGSGKVHRVNNSAAGRDGGLVELDLLPGGFGRARPENVFDVREFRAPLRPDGFRPVLTQANPDINWVIRPNPLTQNVTVPAPSSSSLMPYFIRPLQLGNSGVGDITDRSSNIRVVNPPRRPHSGVWFVLQASQNQVKEPFLPQIPKSYLRIKDGKMTVLLLIKYLMNKLRLDNESEIEIRCRGQEVEPLLTLQHVRDNIWNYQRDSLTILSHSSPVDHVMVLHYARTP